MVENVRLIPSDSRATFLQDETSTFAKSSATQQYETIVVGDPYCGKTTYLTKLVEVVRPTNSQINLSDTNNEFEFWLDYKSVKSVFTVRDTASVERFRSLTQTHYRKAQCVLLIFDLNNEESFFNLKKWYLDIVNYTTNQSVIVLVGLKRTEQNAKCVDEEMIELFQEEHDKIIGYCEIDLIKLDNLKEPFERIINNYRIDSNGGRKSIANIHNYSTIRLETPYNKELQGIEINQKSNDKKRWCCCFCLS